MHELEPINNDGKTTDDYVDLRDILDGYERRICPECGTEEWFEHKNRERWKTDQWNCWQCGSYYEDILEYPCPECDIRMVLDNDTFECRNVECDFTHALIDKSGLIDALSSDDFMVRGMPGVWAGDCPVCGAEHGIDGGPDGELTCSECNDFYAGQYSDVWFCYALWKHGWQEDRERIRVNPP